MAIFILYPSSDFNINILQIKMLQLLEIRKKYERKKEKRKKSQTQDPECQLTQHSFAVSNKKSIIESYMEV